MTSPRILCVDDEPNVLEALQRALHNGFDVSVSSSGPAALARLAAGESFEVIVSDMRMPGMNGAALLAEFRLRAPDTVRLLLTGEADLDSAAAALNDGLVFRSLTKPCPLPALVAALKSATQRHRQIATERVSLGPAPVGNAR